jgi:hypothetical protein
MNYLFALLVSLHERENVVVGLGDEEWVVVELDDGTDKEVLGAVEERVLGEVGRLVLARLFDSATLEKADWRAAWKQMTVSLHLVCFYLVPVHFVPTMTWQ